MEFTRDTLNEDVRWRGKGQTHVKSVSGIQATEAVSMGLRGTHARARRGGASEPTLSTALGGGGAYHSRALGLCGPSSLRPSDRSRAECVMATKEFLT